MLAIRSGTVEKEATASAASLAIAATVYFDVPAARGARS